MKVILTLYLLGVLSAVTVFVNIQWHPGRGKEPVKSIKEVYFCIDIYNSELSFCVLDLDALIDFNDLPSVCRLFASRGLCNGVISQLAHFFLKR